MKEGKGKMEYNKGNIYNGNRENNEINGLGRIYYNNKNIFDNFYFMQTFIILKVKFLIIKYLNFY